MKRKLLAVLLVIMSVFIFASCDLGSINLPGIGGGTGDSSQNGEDAFDPNKVTLMSAYSQAQELGFEGTLEEFIELISGKDGAPGKDGVGISDIIVDSRGHIITVLTNGTTKDLGKLSGVDAITPTFELKDGELMVSYDNGETWSSLGNVQGANGANAITPQFKLENGELMVSYDNRETWSSLGKIRDDGYVDGGGESNPEFGDEEYNYTWSQTDVLFEMNEHSNSDELESGVRRYYAGADVDATQDIDTAIRQRNREAIQRTGVTPRYTYLADGNKAYGWGANVGRIRQLTNVGGSNCPDVFVNFAYDLTCAQIRGCFANLLDTSWELGNHFYFANNEMPETENYFDAEAGEGYFYEYMRSLSLTPDTKLYCLGSNYCVDLVRAFIVIPVNVDLMNSIVTLDTSNGLAGDRDNDGDHDIVDFYNLVWNNEWTYNVLAAYSNAVFRGNMIESAKTDFADNVVGFILGVNSGIPGAGMLYSSSIDIIEYNDAKGKYEYPTTNQDLTDFATALAKLMTDNATKGICTVDRATANKYDAAASTELIGIRHKFAKNGILFGGTIMVGSLEDTDYQEMRKGSGFGVVPVPLYKAYQEDVNYYQTLVHNMARIVAIAECSTEKSQASAYLDYQSRNSADILEEYYTGQLAAKVGGVAGENNVRMLTYIRNHVRSCFDKTFEDAIADYKGDTDSNALMNRWHYRLQSEKFVMSGISTMYDSLRGDKQETLDDIYEQWNTLN